MFDETLVQQAREAWGDIGSKSFKTTYKTLYTDVKKVTTFLPTESSPTRRLYHVCNNLPSIPICVRCGVGKCSWNNWKKTYSTVCSKRCSRNNGEYDKRKATCVQKYGYENPRRSSIIKQQIRRTMLNKYGVDNYFKSDDFVNLKQKILGDQRTNVSQLHIPTNSLNLLECKDWCIDQHIIQQKPITQIAAELGYSDVACVSNRFKAHGITIQNFFRSKGENAVADFITSLGVSVVRGCRTLLQNNQEIDIYIPSHNLAIEFCGLFWHNELTKSRGYHKSKYDQCKEQGIQLLTIFEDEWAAKPNLIKSTIAHKLKLSNQPVTSARRCTIATVSTKEKKSFFDQTHIQGDGPSSVAYGLIDTTGTTVAVASFMITDNWLYLVRYSTKAVVRGGLSRILTHAMRTHNINRVYTFADARWSNGDAYKAVGFVPSKHLPPDYSYIVNGQRHHKFAFRHKHLKTKLARYDPTLSEVDNCHANKIYRIWDCGKIRFNLIK